MFLGIIATVTSLTFIVNLFILEEVLHIMNVLSIKLQQKFSTLGKSSNLIHGVIDTFKKARSSESWDKLWIDIKKFIEMNDVSVESFSTEGKICFL